MSNCREITTASQLLSRLCEPGAGVDYMTPAKSQSWKRAAEHLIMKGWATRSEGPGDAFMIEVTRAGREQERKAR